MIELREGTSDWAVWHNICDNNEYNLPDKVNGVVVDIGAHIGAFTYEVSRRGADKVYAYEPDSKNAQLFLRNTSSCQNVHFDNVAIWGNYTGNISLCDYPYENPNEINTGGRSAIFIRAPGITVVPCYSFFWVLEATGGYIDLLKLDCEGAEMSILYQDAVCPSNVKKIVGEYHNIGNDRDLALHSRLLNLRSGSDIKVALESRGYSVKIDEHKGGVVGKFYADS